MIISKGLTAALALCAGGAMVGVNAGEESKPAPKPKQEEKVDQAKIYLNEFAGYLTVEPRDGVFGMGRVPTIHGGRVSGPKIQEAFLEMGKTTFVAGMAFGRLGTDEVRYSTAPSHYQLHQIPAEALGLGEREEWDLQSRLTSVTLPEEARKLWNSGRKDSRFNVPYGKLTATVTMRKVMPSYETCLNCHGDVPRGKAIGVLAVVQVPKGSAKP